MKIYILKLLNIENPIIKNPIKILRNFYSIVMKILI